MYLGEEYIIQFYIKSRNRVPLAGASIEQAAGATIELFNIFEIVSSDPRDIDLLLSINWPQRPRWSLASIEYESPRDTNCCSGMLYSVYKYLVCDNNGGSNSAYANLLSYGGEFKVYNKLNHIINFFISGNYVYIII